MFRRLRGEPKPLPGDLLFREVQRFRDTWLWPALVLPAVAASVYVLYVVIRTVFFSEEGASLAKSAVALGFAFYIVKGFGSLIVLLYAARLEVEVRTAGLFVRLAPFQRKYRHVTADQLQNAHVEATRLRVQRGWRVYAVKGAKAVRLRTAGGHRLMIGTQQPDQLAAALARTV